MTSTSSSPFESVEEDGAGMSLRWREFSIPFAASSYCQAFIIGTLFAYMARCNQLIGISKIERKSRYYKFLCLDFNYLGSWCFVT
jgi:hypothetical protein